MGHIPNYVQLQALSDAELIARYDAEAVHTVVGTGFYREELARRQLARESQRMLDMTATIRSLTWIVLALTAANAILVAVQVWLSTRAA